jgi:dTDP-glucose 4,6-dehydratase
MKNLLVTGGAGFIGSNFVRFVLGADPNVNVVNLDALTYAGSLENLRDLPDETRHTFVQGDICDAGLVSNLMQRHSIDTIIHFAAETHVDRSITAPGQFIQTNIVGTYTLLEAARQFWLADKALGEQPVRFHHVSTDEVFGTLGTDDPAWTEDTPYAPSSPYAASKAASDHLVRAYGHTYGLPHTITNCSNNYGPYQFPEKLIPLMVANLLEGKPLPVYGDGGQIRDWLYVEDHCEAIWLILHKGQVGETYNIGGNNQPTNITVVRTLCEIADELLPDSPYTPHAQLIEYVKDRPGHDRRYAMDASKLHRELGWRPRQTLESGLLKTARWYMDNADWIAKAKGSSDYQQWIERNYRNREAT